MLKQGLVGEVLVAIHYHLADGNPVALGDVEDDPGPARLRGKLHHLDLGGVVALVLVEGIDGGARLFHRVAVQRTALGEMDSALDLALPHPIDTAHSPLLQHRAFLHPQDQQQVLSLIPLLNQDIVELPGLEQRGNGPLDIAVIDGLVNDDARAADDLGWGEALVSLDYDAVNRRRAGLLSRENRLPSTGE